MAASVTSLEHCMLSALEDVVAGRVETVAPLPIDKAAYPRLLCLDFKDWIELARARKGERPHLSAVRERIDAARRAGTLVVAVADANAYEAELRTDPSSRAELVATLVEESGNRFLRPSLSILAMEILACVGPTPAPLDLVRPRAMVAGIAKARGGHLTVPSGAPAIAQAMWDSLVVSPTYSEWLLMNAVSAAFRRDHLASEREAEPGLVNAQENDRNFSEAENRDGALAAILTDAVRWLCDDPRTRAAGLALLDDGAHDTTRAKRVLESCPSVDVLLRLGLQRARNPSNKIKGNDHRDLDFLRVAIPYANIVVTEGLWANLATQSRVDEEYGTTVLSRLDDVVSTLESQGCI